MRIFGKSDIRLPHPHKNALFSASVLGINPNASCIKRPLFLLRSPLALPQGRRRKTFFTGLNV
ncbi:MAG: hypothetical protein Q4A06_00950 [Cardiobacteriaceae bacterium]|nr:hypothetical protein [Cardiobacteriaceae bacterium]